MTSLDDKSTPLQTSQKWGLLRKTSAIVLTIFCYIHSVKHRKRKQIVCQSKRQHPMPLICFQRRCLRHVVWSMLYETVDRSVDNITSC